MPLHVLMLSSPATCALLQGAIRMLCARCPSLEAMMHTWQVTAETVLYASEDNLKIKSMMLHPEDHVLKTNKPPPNHKMYGLYCKLEALKQKQEDEKRAGKNKSLAMAARATVASQVAKSQERLRREAALGEDQTLGNMSSMTLAAELSESSTMSARYGQEVNPCCCASWR